MLEFNVIATSTITTKHPHHSISCMKDVSHSSLYLYKQFFEVFIVDFFFILLILDVQFLIHLTLYVQLFTCSIFYVHVQCVFFFPNLYVSLLVDISWFLKLIKLFIFLHVGHI